MLNTLRGMSFVINFENEKNPFLLKITESAKQNMHSNLDKNFRFRNIRANAYLD